MNASSAQFVLVLLVALVALLWTHRTVHAQTYQYDAAGRVSAALYTSGASIRYTYDAAGNVTRIQHIPAPPAALPPDGVIDTPSDDVTITAGESVDFTGSATDPDGAVPLTFRWDFDGGAPESTDEDPGPTVFNTPGTYTVEFNVTDATSLADPTPDTVIVTVNAGSTSGGGGGGTGGTGGGGGTGGSSGGGTGGSGGSGGGGGSLLWLPFGVLLVLLARVRRILAIGGLVLISGLALAQGTSWQVMPSPTTENLNAVWGFSSSEVYAVGNNGAFLEFDGQRWSNYADFVAPADLNLNAIWGRSPNDMYLAGSSRDPNTPVLFHFDGTGWTDITVPGMGGLVDVWSAGPGEPLYVISGVNGWQLDAGLDPGEPSNWLQRGFVEQFSGDLRADARLQAIGGAARDVLMVGVGIASTDRPGLYRNFSRVSFFTRDMTDVFAFSDSQMVIVGTQSYLLNGDVRTFADWTEFTSMRNPIAVWGTASDNFYVVGTPFSSMDGLIYYHDGSSSVEQVRLASRTFSDIHGFGPDSAFAVGSGGLIYGLSATVEQPTAANYPNSGLVNDFINAYTGELVYETTDLSVGHEFPIELRRYYASNLTDQRTVGGALTRNWTHNYEWDVVLDDPANPTRITVRDYRGREFEFGVFNGDWRLEDVNSANVTLSVGAAGILFADLEAELVYGFRASGILEFIEDRNGNRHDLIYMSGFLTAVVDAYGNSIAFQYSNGLLAKAWIAGASTEPELTMAYTHSNGVLVSATEQLVNGTAITPQVDTIYSYSSLSADPALLSTIDTGGKVNRVWLYDSEDRVSSTVMTEGGTFDYAYAGGTATVTTPGGVFRTLSHDAEGRLTAETDGVGGTYVYTYDGFGRLASSTDRAGRTTGYAYELESGLLRETTLPGSRTVTRIIEQRSSALGIPFYDVVQIAYPDGRLELFETDTNGNTTRYRDRARSEWTYTYDADGRVVTATNPVSGLTTISRNVRGGIETVTDDAGNITSYRYDNYQRPVEVRYADGSNSEVTWDGFRVSRIELPGGDATDYTYDTGGRLASAMRSDGNTVTFEYDGAGDIARIVDNGDVTTIGYDDFRRPSAVVTPVGERVDMQFDTADNLVRLTDGNRQDWLMQYHPDGVLRQLARPDSSLVNVDNTFDPRGLDVAITDAGERTQYGHDDLGRVVSVIDRLERQTTIDRDEDARRTSINMPTGGLSFDIVENALGLIESVTDAINGTWMFGYDEQGRPQSATDPANRTTTFEQNERNQVERVTYADGVTGTLQYALNQIISQADFSDGTSVALDTTPEGRIVGGTNLSISYSPKGDMIDSNGIGMTHYADGRLRTVTLAAGRTLEYTYDGNGNATLIRDWLGGETTIAYTPRNQWDLLTYPNDVSADYAYTSAGRLQSISYPSIGEVTLALAATGQVQSVARNLPGPTAIEALDLELPRNVASEVAGFSYDARGNRTSDDQRSYDFDALGRLRSYSVPGGQVQLEYDALGNIVREAAPGQTSEYVINYALGRPQTMVERDGMGNDRWYYVFTPRGELLYRLSADGRRQVYHFDQDDNTAFVTDNAGSVIRTYFYSPAGKILDSSASVEEIDRYTTKGRMGAQKLAQSDIVVSLEKTEVAPQLKLPALTDDMFEENATDWAVGMRYNDSSRGSRLGARPPSETVAKLIPDDAAGRSFLDSLDEPGIFLSGSFGQGTVGEVDSAWDWSLVNGSPGSLLDESEFSSSRQQSTTPALERGGYGSGFAGHPSDFRNPFELGSPFRSLFGGERRQAEQRQYHDDTIYSFGFSYLGSLELRPAPKEAIGPALLSIFLNEDDAPGDDTVRIPAMVPFDAPNPTITAPGPQQNQGTEQSTTVDSILKEIGFARPIA